MKKVIVALALVAFSTSTITSNAFAQEVVSTEKVQVKKEELPEAVVKTLATEAYQGAEFVSANLINGEVKIYEVALKKDGKDMLVKIDEKGAIL